MRNLTWMGLLALLLAGILNPVLLPAASSVVWQIGVFDDSSHEFNLGIDPESGKPTAHPIDYTDPNNNPVFVIGKSNPAWDWYAYQPGTSNGRAGFRAHPFTIQFDLPEKPKGLFTLNLSPLDYSPRLPRLEVNLNGHRGLFYQHPVLNYGRGDILRFVEVGGQSTSVKVTSPLLEVQSAWRCNSLEENQRPLEVSPHGFTFQVKPFEIVTVRVEGSSVSK